MGKVSVVINILNEEKNIERVIKSADWADEIIIVDDGSTDDTLKILDRIKKKNDKIKVFHHQSAGFVEPARNFAITHATSEWILILDADEEIPDTLASKLQKIAKETKQIDYVEIPRQNIIFGKWMENAFWWPDVNIRFFKRGKVQWTDKIHSKPKTSGYGIKLEPKIELAIKHGNYLSLDQYLERMSRYSRIQAQELVEQGYKFAWQDLVTKPLGEFLSRFFANKGYKDGLHGLSLSLLQAFSFLVVYLRVWEMEKFPKIQIDLKDLEVVHHQVGSEINYWFKFSNLAHNPVKRFLQKVKSSISK